MTTHPPILCIWFKLYLPNTTFLWFTRLPTPLHRSVWILAISQAGKCHWKEPNLSQEKTLCRMRWPGWSPFQKMHSICVSNNGGSAGRSVCITKETTLKRIRVLYLLINKCISADQTFDTFWTNLISAPIESSATCFNLQDSIITPTYLKTIAEIVWCILYTQTLHRMWWNTLFFYNSKFLHILKTCLAFVATFLRRWPKISIWHLGFL